MAAKTQPSNARTPIGIPDNIDYMIQIKSNQGLDIISRMPETMNLSIQSNWEPLIGNFIDSIVGNGVASAGRNALQAVGIIGKQFSVSQTVQSWSGTEPLQLNLQLIFDAVNDAYTDVYVPVVQLMKLVAPHLGSSGLLTPPGPTGLALAEAAVRGSTAITEGVEGEIISIFIGRHIKFTGVVVKAVEPQFDTRLTEAGYPVSADVNITIETSYVPTKQTLDQIFAITGADRTSSDLTSSGESE